MSLVEFLQTQNALPAYEIAEGEKEFVVSLDLPGVKQEDLTLEVVENTLIISGARKKAYGSAPTEEKASSCGFDSAPLHGTSASPGGGGHAANVRTAASTRRYGRFERRFHLPNNLQTDKIAATFVDGVLSITLPKAEGAGRRKISIHTDAQTRVA